MSDVKQFKHGEEGTHYACEEMVKKLGDKVGCCECNNHECKYGHDAVTLEPLPQSEECGGENVLNMPMSRHDLDCPILKNNKKLRPAPPVPEGKSFFDLPEQEKREIIEKAAEDANEAQRKLMEQAISSQNDKTEENTNLSPQVLDTWEDQVKGSIRTAALNPNNPKAILQTEETLISFIRDLLESKHDKEYEGLILGSEAIGRFVDKKIAQDRQSLITAVEQFDTGGMDTILKEDVLKLLKGGTE